MPTNDPVNHPSHYTFGKYEVIDVLMDWFASDPLLWQVGKYIARADRKGSALEDLKKARFYLEKRIETLEITQNGKVLKKVLETPKRQYRICNDKTGWTDYPWLNVEPDHDPSSIIGRYVGTVNAISPDAPSPYCMDDYSIEYRDKPEDGNNG